MVKYITKLFTEYVNDKRLNESIVEEFPVHDNIPALKVPKVDDFIADIFAARKQDYGRAVDENWAKVQARVLDIMGALGKMWVSLELTRKVQMSLIFSIYLSL